VPTALLQGSGVTWSAIDDSTARATIADGSVAVLADFHFGLEGQIVRVSAMRYRDVRGKPVLTAWVGHFRDYQRMHGLLVAGAADVAWLPAEGPLPYSRARIEAIQYEVAAEGNGAR
jgi:hypothetical protein